MAQISELLKEYKLTNVKAVDISGNTLLHLAVENEKFTQKEIIKIMEIVLDRGIDVDIKNWSNETVLQLAIEKRLKDVIDFLLKRKANIDSAAHFIVRAEFEKILDLSKQSHVSDSEIQRIETESASFLEWLITKGLNFDCKNEEGHSALMIAIERNLQHILAILLKCTKDINFIDHKNRTLLHLFLERRTYPHNIVSERFYSERYASEIVKILLDRGISVDTENNSKRTPIRLAIENQEHGDLIQMLLEHSKNINHKSSDGATVFFTVIWKWVGTKNRLLVGELHENYYLRVARALIEKGADVNEPNDYGTRPLFHAVDKHHLNAAELLRDNGADFSLTTQDGATLLHLFVASKYFLITNEEVQKKLLKLLLELSTDVNRKNSDGNTAFHTLICKWSCLPDTVNDYYMRVACALLDHGADINQRNERGNTPLGCAVEKRDFRIIEFLLQNGADPSMTTSDSDTPLHLFVKSSEDSDKAEDEIKLLDLLISKNCPVNAKDKTGLTALHIAVKDGHMVFVRKLVEHGADVNCTNNHKETPLFDAIQRRDLDMIDVLKKNGADFSMTTEDGESLMHLLVKTKFNNVEKELFELLINKGCQVNAKDKTGTTPLHVAAMHSDVDVVRELVEHGARVNCRNNEMETPLHFATKNCVNVIGLLLQHGANVNAKNSKGQTPLHKIALEPRSENSRVGLRQLLLRGADINARDSENQSVMSCARSGDLADLLQKRQAWVDEQNELSRQKAVRKDEKYIEYYDDDDDDIDSYSSDDNDDDIDSYSSDDNDDNNDDDDNDDSDDDNDSDDGDVDVSPRLEPIDGCPIQDVDSGLMEDLRSYSMKLKAVDLSLDNQIFDSFWNSEIQKLKCTDLDQRTSLYDFLHMHSDRKRVYVNNTKLKNLFESSKRKEQFPVFSVLIVTSYNEAMTRRKLLEPAMKAWLELTGINLPALCLDLIFSFLSNEELFLIIENDD